MTGGLNIPDSMGVDGAHLGAQEAREINEKWTTFYGVEQELASWGFKALGQPQVSYPHITPDILSGADTVRYTEVYQQVSEWYAYTSNVFHRIKARSLEISNEMSRVKLKIKNGVLKAAKEAKEKKPAQAIIDDICESHPRYEELLLEKQRVDQQKFSLQSHLERAERDWKLISRQIEIRKEEHNSRTVGNNMGYRGTPAGTGMYPGGG
jgi:hypothetical protein